MTPGKRHEILVPETPTGKNGRRKSDGTQVVNESPNIDLLKQEGTSRALSASILVRNRTSFYSGMSLDIFFPLNNFELEKNQSELIKSVDSEF